MNPVLTLIPDIRHRVNFLKARAVVQYAVWFPRKWVKYRKSN